MASRLATRGGRGNRVRPTVSCTQPRLFHIFGVVASMAPKAKSFRWVSDDDRSSGETLSLTGISSELVLLTYSSCDNFSSLGNF